MSMSRVKRSWQTGVRRLGAWAGACLLVVFLVFSAPPAETQSAAQDSLAQRIEQLTDAMAKTQAQMNESQRELEQMKEQLNELERQVMRSQPSPARSQQASVESQPASASAQTSSQPSAEAVLDSMTAAIQDLRERQAVTESEIATQAQDKVESESKYPVRISGTLLLNGFVNRGAVDAPAAPSVAIPGPGSAGASVRQTTLGIDAQGPHLWGASSYADLRVDFFGSPGLSTSAGSYSGLYNNSALLRLRTVHAGIQWDRSRVFFSLDRPIISPETPTSLTAVAEPPLAWSGNLWTWNPQIGATATLGHPGLRGAQLEAALINTGDAPITAYEPSSDSTITPPSAAERSSEPGVEAHIAALGILHDRDRNRLGLGGYFAPHQSAIGSRYDSWAATIDERVRLLAHLQLTGSFYRGQALGGLGGGGYKDFAYAYDPDTGGYYFRPLDDAGGWAQLKERVSERLEFNGAAGMDNVFAGQLKHYFVPTASMMQNLARNRTYTGNVIYSPSAYLLFSLEYRRIESTPVAGASAQSNVLSAGAGYRF